MASRRLDISSLLCDDPQPPFSPLDVLVHAATEERRRLEQSPPPPPLHAPQHPQLLHYDRRDQDLAQQRAHALDFHRLQQDRERALRQQDLDRRRREEDGRRLFDYERQQEYELRKREELLREEHLRAEQFRELERRKLDEQRELERREHEHRELERRELELERRRELERRELERRELERRELERREFERMEIERQLVARQQREAVERQLELDRRREQERLDELRRRQHQQIQLDHQPRYLESRPVVTSPHPPSISHLISHPVSPRPADRHQINPLPTKMPPDSPTIAIPTPSQEDPRPIKKRRYSESPTRPIPDDKEHIARERDKMVVGELGYGRVESPAVAPPHPPRRPGSGHGHSRKVAVSDLLTVDKERPISCTPEIRDRDAHRVLSPLGGRRSPPGSQIGRAKAARKSDEYLLREPPPQPVDTELKKPKDEHKVKNEFKPSRSHETIRSPLIDDARATKPISKELPPSLAAATASAPAKTQPPARKGNQEDVYEWFLQQYEEEPSPTISVEPPRTPSPSLSPTTAVAPSGAKSPLVPQRSPFTAAVSIEEELEELVSKPQMSNSALPVAVRKQDPDIDMELDVDLAVNELVETLEADDGDSKQPKAMEVDVEDELLSLLDDTPKPAASSTSSSAARRNPLSSAAAISFSSHAAGTASHPHSHTHSHSHAVHTKQPQAHNRSASEAPHVSPVISNTAAAVLSPVSAVRHSSTRPTSERGSMPPPASTSGAVKKGTESTSSVSPVTTTASATVTGSIPTAKKKKETTAKATATKAKNANGAAAPSTTSTTPATAKPKAKAAAKGKKGAAAEAISAGATASMPAGPSTGKGAKGPAGVATGRKTAPSVSASRSRSASVMPAGNTSVGPESDAVRAEKQEEEEDSEADANEDDKLYCVCKTKYDEDRFMIACDRCDEWYHTQCVKMPDLEVDLVDQFICPVCIEKNPHLNLRTTYKPRCLYGLRHPDPSSTKACHKAARGAFSKYCSDECGVKYMQSRIDTWAKKGGKTDKLWDSVKGAEKREGMVCAVEVESEEEEEEEEGADPTVAPAQPEAKKEVNGCVKVQTNGAKKEEDEEDEDESIRSPKEQKPPQPPLSPKHKKHHHIKTRVVPPTKSKVARETERLNGLLDAVIRLREEIKRGMEVVIWRERLLQLASERAEALDQCGWDQRLCMDDQEWADIGAGVLESYEDAVFRAEAAKEDGADGEMDVDAEEQWWCAGKKVCDRHQGWQTVRYKDVSKEKEKKEEALAKLTTREREIRKRIEDMLDPQNTNHHTTVNHTTIHVTGAKDATHAPLKSSNTKSVNGHVKSKAAASSGDAHKKGKKRKAPAS